MPRWLLWLAVATSLSTLPLAAQNRPPAKPPAAPARMAATEGVPLAGKWTYRSYNNTTDLVGGDANQALALIFGEGVFTFETPSATSLKGTFDMGGGFVLDLDGVVSGAPGAPLAVKIFGRGRAGTPTANWEYDYDGILAFQWPNGVNQVPSLVGSVIRAKPHDGAPAGYVASFIAVKQS
jgi:hypothetical protein